jgi:hypothetical protein
MFHLQTFSINSNINSITCKKEKMPCAVVPVAVYSEHIKNHNVCYKDFMIYNCEPYFKICNKGKSDFVLLPCL